MAQLMPLYNSRARAASPWDLRTRGRIFGQRGCLGDFIEKTSRA